MILLNKKLAKRNTKHEYLLGRRLTCAKCGYTYVGRTRRDKHYYYFCNGRQQTPVKLCDLPNFQGNRLDTIVWEWVKSLIHNPKMIAEGFMDMQEETKRNNSVLFDRLAIIEQKIDETEEQITKLLDLYLTGDFPRNILAERKSRLEELLEELRQEHESVSTHVQKTVYSEEQINELEHFCAAIRDGLDAASFDDKQRIFDLLNVRGKLAVENGEKVVYVKCLIAQQQLSVVATSLSSNTGATASLRLAFRRTVQYP